MEFGPELNLELFAKRDKVWSSFFFTWSTNMGIPFGGLLLFFVAFTTPRTAVSLDRWLLESDKVVKNSGK